MVWGILSAVALGAVFAAPSLAVPPKDDGGLTVGLLPLRVEGRLPGTGKSELENHLLLGLTRQTSRVVPPDDLAGAPRCVEAACWRSLAQSVRVEFLVVTQIERSERDYEIDLRIIDGATGIEQDRRQSKCEICGIAEVATQLSTEAQALLGPSERARAELATLAISTVPAGATVTIGQQIVGETPLTVRVAPGVHDVEIAKPGFGLRKQRVQAQPRGHATMAFDLKRQIHPAWSWGAASLGTALLVPGITMLVLDERPHGPTCNNGNRDESGNCPRRWNTLGVGVGLTTTGTALLAAGIALAIVAYRGGGSNKHTARMVPAPGGVAVSF